MFTTFWITINAYIELDGSLVTQWLLDAIKSKLPLLIVIVNYVLTLNHWDQTSH